MEEEDRESTSGSRYKCIDSIVAYESHRRAYKFTSEFFYVTIICNPNIGINNTQQTRHRKGKSSLSLSNLSLGLLTYGFGFASSCCASSSSCTHGERCSSRTSGYWCSKCLLFSLFISSITLNGWR